VGCGCGAGASGIGMKPGYTLFVGGCSCECDCACGDDEGSVIDGTGVNAALRGGVSKALGLGLGLGPGPEVARRLTLDDFTTADVDADLRGSRTDERDVRSRCDPLAVVPEDVDTVSTPPAAEFDQDDGGDLGRRTTCTHVSAS